jgi:hypothetical protein
LSEGKSKSHFVAAGSIGHRAAENPLLRGKPSGRSRWGCGSKATRANPMCDNSDGWACCDLTGSTPAASRLAPSLATFTAKGMLLG